MVSRNVHHLSNNLIKFLIFILIISGYNFSFAQHRLMPLGNSITLGEANTGIFNGYRDDLYNLLINNGMNYNFVGSQQDGESSQFDTEHEGHAGWKAQDIDANINTWLQDSSPTIVLLHIGTNDISAGESNQNNINEIESIVDKIYNYNPNMVILVCSIIPRLDCENEKCTKTEELNSLIQQLINQKANSGYDIYHVDQYSAFTSHVNWENDYMSDNIHPNNTGYYVMAESFFNVLKDINIPPPEFTLSIIVNPEGAGSVVVNPDKDKYYYNEVVYITANPIQEYYFDHWDGVGGDNTTNPRTIIMLHNREIIANFVNDAIEIVSIPDKPEGPSEAEIGLNLTFSTGGSVSSQGNEVEYQFDWGDGTQSSWGSSTRSHSYGSSGVYELKARAHSEPNPDVLSNWSGTHSVNISGYVKYTLSINTSPTGSGNIAKSPDKSSYERDEWVQLSAKPYCPDDNIRIEAESGELSGPIGIGSDTEASGSEYIYGTTADPQVGNVEYTFNIEGAGTYIIWGRCYALSNSEDSFFIQVDGSPDILTWHLETDYYQWKWQKVSDNHVLQEFSLAAGQHTLKVIKRDINVRLDKIIITKDINFQPFGKEEIMDIRMEAESGIINSPIEIGNDSEASGSEYIYAPDGDDNPTHDPNQGRAEYSFSLNVSCNYTIWGRINSTSGGGDTFFFVVDGSADTLLWDLGSPYNTWRWIKFSDRSSGVFNQYLNAGQHTLTIIKRECNAYMDKIIFSNNAGFTPSGKEEGGALQNVCYQFDHWEGDLTGSSNPADVLVDRNKAITACFVEAGEVVTIPTIPVGPDVGFTGQALTFMTGGAVSSKGNNVEYQFDWGDGSFSDWCPGTKDHIYASINNYEVKARARSQVDTMAVSNWSEGHSTTISGITLSISIDPQETGTVTKNPDQTYYNYGDTITLEPMAADGYLFDHWSGDLTGDDNPIKIAMNNNKTVIAIFAETPEVVSKPKTISGLSSGIMGQTLTFVTGGAVSNLGNEVEYQFDWGDGIFSEWGPSTNEHMYYSTGTMEVKSRARSKVHQNVISDWSNVHIVVISGYSLTIVVNPDTVGYVFKNPDKPKYASEWNVELSATGISGYGYAFDHWEGDLTGTENPKTIIMNSDKQVMAYFSKTKETVSIPTFISASDSGIVGQTLSFSTGGAKDNFAYTVEYRFDWGDGTLSAWGDSTREYSYNTIGVKDVKSRARSKINTSVVSQWTEAHPVVVYSINYTITINVEPNRSGSVNKQPFKDEYAAGDTVMLTPIPVTGYVFDYWSGDLIGITIPKTLIIYESKNITANFRRLSDVVNEKADLLNKFTLSQNFPNPFNPETTIQYQLAKNCNVKIIIYNVHGQIVNMLIDESQSAGYYDAHWNGVDSRGNKVPSGVYLYQLETEYFTEIKKMILIK